MKVTIPHIMDFKDLLWWLLQHRCLDKYKNGGSTVLYFFDDGCEREKLCSGLGGKVY